jgi:hypothetical protein
MTIKQASMAVLLALTAGFGGCRGEGKGATDTSSNWLGTCGEGETCGDGLECLCGVCSRSCETTLGCAEFGNEAACVSPAECGNTSICGLAEGAPNEESPSEPEPELEVEPEPFEAGAPQGGGGSSGEGGSGASNSGPALTTSLDAGPSDDTGGSAGATASGGGGEGGTGSSGGGSSGADGGIGGSAGVATGGASGQGGAGQGSAGDSSDVGGGGNGGAGNSGGAPSSSCAAGEFTNIEGVECQCVADDHWSCTSYASACETPAGMELDVVVRSEYGSSPFSCFADDPPRARPIHSEEDFQAALCGAGSSAPSGVNWSERMMYAAVVYQGQELALVYAALSNGIATIAVQGSCAITGAAPGHGVMFLEFDIVDAVFIEQICPCPSNPGPEPEPLPP